MCVLLCVFTACVLGEGVEMSSWLDGHSFILLFYNVFTFESCHLASLAYGDGVKKEPFLRDASGKVLDKDLRADFMAHGWGS